MYWIRKLLGLCNHRWIVLRQVRLDACDDDGTVLKRGARFILRCEHCGAVKKKDLL